MFGHKNSFVYKVCRRCFCSLDGRRKETLGTGLTFGQKVYYKTQTGNGSRRRVPLASRYDCFRRFSLERDLTRCRSGEGGLCWRYRCRFGGSFFGGYGTVLGIIHVSRCRRRIGDFLCRTRTYFWRRTCQNSYRAF